MKRENTIIIVFLRISKIKLPILSPLRIGRIAEGFDDGDLSRSNYYGYRVRELYGETIRFRILCKYNYISIDNRLETGVRAYGPWSPSFRDSRLPMPWRTGNANIMPVIINHYNIKLHMYLGTYINTFIGERPVEWMPSL